MEVDEQPTGVISIYASDVQPARLLAELEGCTTAELIHRAIGAYIKANAKALAEQARKVRALLEEGDVDGLAGLLAATRLARRSARGRRLAALVALDHAEEGRPD